VNGREAVPSTSEQGRHLSYRKWVCAAPSVGFGNATISRHIGGLGVSRQSDEMANFRMARQPVRIRGFVQSAIPLRFVVIASRRLSTGSVLILGACNKTQPARVVGETNWLIQFKFARAVSDIPAEPDEAIGGRKFLP